MKNAMRLTETRPGKAKPWRFTFTINRLEALRPPTAGRLWVHDEGCPGLAMQITANNARSFYTYRKVDGRPEKIFIAKYGAITIDEARRITDKHKGKIADGINPAHEKRLARAAATFGEAFRIFIDEHKSRTAKSTERDEQRYKLYLTGLASRKMKEIQPEDVLEVRNNVAKLTSGTTANRVLALISAVFNRITHKTINPARGVERFKEKPRERNLADSEVTALLNALEGADEDLADVVRIALFTGVRRGNIIAARWADMNLTDGLWRIPETKSGAPLEVPLNDELVKILGERKKHAKTEWVFPSHSAAGHIVDLSTSWRSLTAKAKLKGVRFHDLRRTFCVYLAESGATVKTAQTAMGHKTPLTTLKHYSAARAVREATTAATAMMMGKPAKGKGKGKTKK